MNKKMLRVMIILLVVILLAGAGTVYYLKGKSGDAGTAPSIDEVIKDSVDITDLTTNLATSNYIKISFKIQTDSKQASDELTKRNFQVRNIIIEELSDTKAKDIQSKAGKVKLEDLLKQRINQIMQDGKVVQVYITDSLLQ